MSKIKELFGDMKKEVKRIRWCKGKELLSDIIVTISFVIFFALFFVLVQTIVSGIASINFSEIVERISDLF